MKTASSSNQENKNLYTIELVENYYNESWAYQSRSLCDEDPINYETQALNKNILIPMLVWGPNNQLQGFRESVYIAKALNRSIAAPLFFPNWNNKGLPRTLEAPMRLNLKSLTEIMSVINPAEVSNLCDGSVTAIFKTRNNGDGSHFQATLDYYGVKIDEHAEEFWFDRNKYQNGKFIDAIDKHALRQYYSTDKKCAILSFPWSSIQDKDISKQALLPKKSRDENFNDMIEIIDHTRRPKFVRRAVAKFLEEYKVSEFALMHWRYDMRDFFRAMMHKKEEAKTMIENLKSSKKQMKNFSLEISKIMDEKNMTYFYFASPPDEKTFLKEIALGVSYKKFIDDNLLAEFLKKEFQNCTKIMDDFGDLVSLAEMELSYLSNLFVYSCFSTWRFVFT
ncbi:unnamed protein product [Oikopleura dioica]|uniref:Peptide-O-fucosyltransferase n=1 Tax=Oikopleura dioica TaxID=34765 RepID=E4X8G2_OIKDI|nr:unnamed protein product [Oikopleura dioica]